MVQQPVWIYVQRVLVISGTVFLLHGMEREQERSTSQSDTKKMITVVTCYKNTLPFRPTPSIHEYQVPENLLKRASLLNDVIRAAEKTRKTKYELTTLRLFGFSDTTLKDIILPALKGKKKYVQHQRIFNKDHISARSEKELILTANLAYLLGINYLLDAACNSIVDYINDDINDFFWFDDQAFEALQPPILYRVMRKLLPADYFDKLFKVIFIRRVPAHKAFVWHFLYSHGNKMELLLAINEDNMTNDGSWGIKPGVSSYQQICLMSHVLKHGPITIDRQPDWVQSIYQSFTQEQKETLDDIVHIHQNIGVNDANSEQETSDEDISSDDSLSDGFKKWLARGFIKDESSSDDQRDSDEEQ